MWGTVDRINFLQMSKHFTCRCRRCSDSTELETYFSSIRCQNLSCLSQSHSESQSLRGLIVTEDPYDVEKEWKCNGCGEVYSLAFVMSIVEKVGRDLEKLHELYGDIVAEEEFLKVSSKVLSPNHYYMMEIKLGLAQIYGRTQDEPLSLLSPRKLCRKQQICEDLLKVFNAIVPGYNRLRALILYELQASTGMFTKMRRALEEISIDQHKKELVVCTKWLIEAIKVLEWEHENSIERRRAAGGEIELLEFKNLIEASLSLS